jgi:hypothetical protein
MCAAAETIVITYANLENYGFISGKHYIRMDDFVANCGAIMDIFNRPDRYKYVLDNSAFRVDLDNRKVLEEIENRKFK